MNKLRQIHKQVDSDHYSFGGYYSKQRWMSIWYQVESVLEEDPIQVVEIGGGKGIFKSILSTLGVETVTIDIAQDLYPDRVGSILELPVTDSEFDVSCAFQVLEHLPIEKFETGVGELLRATRKSVVISLPNSEYRYSSRIHIPGLRILEIAIRRPKMLFPIPMCKEHYWEINRNSVSIDTVTKMIEKAGGRNIKTFRPFENPFHQFFKFTK